MINRKILYGYQIRNGELAIQSKEAMTVDRVFSLYLAGLSYQKIADTLNADGVPFSADAPLWNKHKVKRLLENPRYTGTEGYPSIIETKQFQAVQTRISDKAAAYVPAKPRPAFQMRRYLRCDLCDSNLRRMAVSHQRTDILYLKCTKCGTKVTLPDDVLLNEINRQMAEHDTPADSSYSPSGEVVRLANAINRALEHPETPEHAVSLILLGASARYDCCPPADNKLTHRPVEADLKGFDRAVSYISISKEAGVTVHFK